MTDELAFFRAAAANPDDDLPRLVYADWLDEQGTEASAARAAFVRLQVRRSALGLWHPDRAALLKEEAGILHRFARTWNGPLHRRLHAAGLKNQVASRRALIRGWDYHRGMIGRVTVDGEVLRANPEAIFDLGAVAAVRVVNWEGWLGDQHPIRFPPSVRAVRLAGGWAHSLPEWTEPHPTAVIPLLDLRAFDLGIYGPRFLDLCRRGYVSPVLLVRQWANDRYRAGPRIIDPLGKWAALRPWYEELTGRVIDAGPYPNPAPAPIPVPAPQPPAAAGPQPEPPSLVTRVRDTLRRYGLS